MNGFKFEGGIRALSSCPSQGLAFQSDVTFRYFFQEKKIVKGLIMAAHCICFLPMVPFPFAGNAMARPWATRSGFKPSALPCNFGAHVLGRTTGPIDGGLFLASRPSWIQKIFGESAESSASKNGSVVLLVSLGMPGD